MLRIAHRGSSTVYTENTIAAFDHAFTHGAQAIELDVRNCKHDELVVMHDSTVDRTTDGNGRLKRMTLDEVKALRTEDDLEIPTLEEVLRHLGPGYRCFLEVKSPHIAAQVGGLISELVLADGLAYADLMVISFYPSALRDIAELNGEIITGINMMKAERYDASALSGALALTGDVAADVLAAKALGVTCLSVHIDDVTAELVQAAKAESLAVYCWTAKEEAQVRHAKNCGVDGVMADDMAFLQRALKQ